MSHNTQQKNSLFKPHIDNFTSDLNQKAGRTSSEVKDLLKGKKLYKLSSNENAMGPSPKALEAIQEVLPTLYEYGFRTDDVFRDALEEAFDHEIKEDQFITGNAGLEVIDIACRGFLEPGLEVIVTNPTFHVYEIFAKVNGAKVIDVPLLEGAFELDVEGILAAVNERTRLIFITNPSNPTGTMITKTTLDKLIYNLPDHVVVIHDEVYFHFMESDDFPFAKDYILEGKNVIGLHTFSKAHGLPGLRVAYGFSTPRIAHYLRKLRRPFFINTLSMTGALAAMKDEAHIEASRTLVQTERKWLQKELDRLGIHHWDSHTNFILFKCPMSTDEMIAKMLEYGVMIRSGENNGAPGCIRVSIGVHEANMAFVTALEEIMGG